MKLDENFIEKLYSIPWFCKCGSPFAYDGVISATSTKQVIKSINGLKWENMILDTQGDVTEQLSTRSIKGHGREYQEWNNLVDNFKKDVYPQLSAKWETTLQHYGLNTSVVLNDVSFNILSIAVIDAYKTLVPMPSFSSGYWKFMNWAISLADGEAQKIAANLSFTNYCNTTHLPLREHKIKLRLDKKAIPYFMGWYKLGLISIFDCRKSIKYNTYDNHKNH